MNSPTHQPDAMKERGLRSSCLPAHARGAHVHRFEEAPVSEQYAGRQIVGMDLHRRRSVLVRMTETGETLETVRISNDREYLRQVMERAGEAPEVVLEATYGWYWAADTLAELGAHVHLAHPLGVKMFAYRRGGKEKRRAGDPAAPRGGGGRRGG